MCAGMKWNHLPLGGGIYDQHPKLMDRFYYIMAEQAKWDEAEHKRKNSEMGGKKPGMKPSTRSPGSGKRH